MEKTLTPMEALTILLMIKISRNNPDRVVDVEELSKAMMRSKSTVRTLLNRLKAKKLVVDVSEIKEPKTTTHLGEEGVEDMEDIMEIMHVIRSPNRGVKKKWMVSGLNVMNDEEVIKFIKSRPEFDRYFGLNNVLRFLGVKHDAI